MLKDIRLYLLFSTFSGFIFISPLLSLLGGVLFFLYFALQKTKIYKFELFLILFLSYFFLSTLYTNPAAFIEFDYYRYDGNIWISMLPLFAFAFFKTKIQDKHIIKIFIIVFIIYFIYFLVWLLIKNCSFGGYCTFPGLYEARNASGGYISILSLILLLYGFNKKNKFFLLLSLISIIILYTTLSRGSLIALLIVLGLIYFFQRFNLKFDIVLFFIMLLVSLGVAYINYDPGRNYNSVDTIYDITEGSDLKTSNVLIRAYFLWPKAYSDIMDSPVFGKGVGSFNNDGKKEIYDSTHAHNSFLHFWAELGIFGLGLYLLFVYEFRKFWLRHRHIDKFLADISYFSLLVVLFASFSEHRLTTPSSMILVSSLIGLFISKIRFKMY